MNFFLLLNTWKSIRTSNCLVTHILQNSIYMIRVFSFGWTSPLIPFIQNLFSFAIYVTHDSSHKTIKCSLLQRVMKYMGLLQRCCVHINQVRKCEESSLIKQNRMGLLNLFIYIMWCIWMPEIGINRGMSFICCHPVSSILAGSWQRGVICH